MSDKELEKIVIAEAARRAKHELHVRRIVADVAALHYKRQGYTLILGDWKNFDLGCYRQNTIVLLRSTDAEDGTSAAPLIEAYAGLQIACRLHNGNNKEIYAVLIGFGVTPEVADTLKVNVKAWEDQGEISNPEILQHKKTLELTYKPAFTEKRRNSTQRVLMNV